MLDPTSNPQTEVAAKLVAAAFGVPNILEWPDPAQLSPEIQASYPSIEAYLRGQQHLPLVIPSRTSIIGQTTWYLCCHSDEHCRQTLSDLQAFVGPVWANLGPRNLLTVPLDSIENALLHRFGQRIVRIQADGAPANAWMVNQIALYLSVLEQRPSIPSYLPMSFSQLRARFDRALLVADEDAARQCIVALKERGLLSSENQQYLEIRLMASLGRWEKIVSMPLLATMANLDLPPETFGDVVESLERTVVFPFQHHLTLSQMLTKVHATFEGHLGVLFRSRRRSSRSAVVKMFLLKALCEQSVDKALVTALLAEISTGDLPPSWLDDIEQKSHVPILEDGQVEAKRALDNEDFERAYFLFLGLPPSVENLAGLLRSAREGTPEQCRAAVGRVAEQPIEIVDGVKGRIPKTWEVIFRVAAKQPKKTWLERVCWQSSAGEAIQDYVDRLRDGALSWNSDDALGEPEFASKAATALEALSLEEASGFEQVLPYWYELFIQRPDAGRHAFLPIYQALLSTLRAANLLGDREMPLITGIVATALECAPTGEQYRELLGELIKILQDRRSAGLIDWALAVCDILLGASCPSEEGRMRFCSLTFELVTGFASRSTRRQRETARLLADEMGIQLPLSSDIESGEGPSSDRGAPAFKRIAIYSLDEAALRRAKAVLLKMYPQVTVELNSDQVCTDRLKNLARSVDRFVFAWKCSSHQAYYCVKDALTEKGKLSLARGAGTSSLVEALEA